MNKIISHNLKNRVQIQQDFQIIATPLIIIGKGWVINK